jgi:hypothetical protein
MKAAYYFSPAQKRFIDQSSFMTLSDDIVIEFTECDNTFEDDSEVPSQNSWEDSTLVYIRENLPVNEVVLKFTGHRVAKTY